MFRHSAGSSTWFGVLSFFLDLRGPRTRSEEPGGCRCSSSSVTRCTGALPAAAAGAGVRAPAIRANAAFPASPCSLAAVSGVSRSASVTSGARRASASRSCDRTHGARPGSRPSALSSSRRMPCASPVVRRLSRPTVTRQGGRGEGRRGQ